MSNRKRVRPSLPSNDQVLTRLGRVTPNPSNNSASASPTTVVQNSGTFPLGGPQPSNADATNSTVIISHFDPEQYRANIKANGHDKKRLEQSVLNAVEYFLSTSKGSGQQNTDYKVLILLSWTVSLHPEIFRSSDIVKALCTVLKGTSLSKATRNLSMMNNGNHQQNPPNVPYLLICQILWSAFQVNVDLHFLFCSIDRFRMNINGRRISLKLMSKILSVNRIGSKIVVVSYLFRISKPLFTLVRAVGNSIEHEHIPLRHHHPFHRRTSTMKRVTTVTQRHRMPTNR